MDQEYDVFGGYVPVFLEHLADTRARFGLGVDPQVHGDQNSAADTLHDDATNSEAVDFSDWTRAERDAFFRGISVYSRWRPDLIAACVPTKSEWEVWRYLDVLEEGAARLATGRGDSKDVEMRVDESVSGSEDANENRDGIARESEGQVVCEPAFEVSQAWIDVEEQMAAWIVRKEEQLASGEDRDAEMPMDDPPAKRPRGRPRGSGKGRAQSRARARAGSDDNERPPPSKPARRRVRNASTSTALQLEEVMGRLELPHLQVLDHILRESEEAMRGGSKSREGSEAVAELSDKEMAEASDMAASSLSIRANTPQGRRTSPSNSVIDPVLLALSGEADPTGQQQLGDPSESTSVGCIPTQDLPSLPDSLFQSTSLGASFEPPFQLASTNQAANVESDLSLLTPRSRRRIQKRLYMRRKRGTLGENAVDTGLGRLKPGKKAKSEQSKASVVLIPVPCSEEQSDAEMEPDGNPKRSKSKGGTRLPYKLKAVFSELGVDAAYLHDQGMDLLNLSALGRVMGLYGEDEEDKSNTAQSIDAELVRHLQSGMVSFVTDVIHRAIVWREREVRLKQRCQAWRSGEQITIGAIEHAVDIVGARYRSHKEYFKSLEEVDGSPTEPSSPGPDDGTDSESVYSPHREVYTPLVRLPSAWRMGPLVSLTRTYEREATRSRRGPSTDVDEDDLMADETDEEALAAELREEEEMDAADMKVSVTEEEGLLNRFKIT